MAGRLEYPQLRVDIEHADSPLGRWGVAHWAPASGSPLDEVIDAIWYFDGATTHSRERVFPDGAAELIVQLDDVYRDADAGSVPFPAVCINGLRTAPSVVEAPGTRTRVLGIRLSPHGACALLDRPIADLLDVTVDLSACVGASTRELADRCHDAAESATNAGAAANAVVRAAVWWVLQRIAHSRPLDPIVPWALGQIRDANGVVSVESLHSQAGQTRARFAARLRSYLGVTPKRYARIMRFHRAISSLGTDTTLAQVALDLNYYDQPHMYRDFCQFAGMTPAAFLAAKRYPNSASLAEQ